LSPVTAALQWQATRPLLVLTMEAAGQKGDGGVPIFLPRFFKEKWGNNRRPGSSIYVPVRDTLCDVAAKLGCV